MFSQQADWRRELKLESPIVLHLQSMRLDASSIPFSEASSQEEKTRTWRFHFGNAFGDSILGMDLMPSQDYVAPTWTVRVSLDKTSEATGQR